MEAEDLVAAVFPDQLACPENLVGDREIPIIRSSIRRSRLLLEAMDFRAEARAGGMEGASSPSSRATQRSRRR